jgi:hypothetical protein
VARQPWRLKAVPRFYLAMYGMDITIDFMYEYFPRFSHGGVREGKKQPR